MIRERIDISAELELLIGLITSKVFCSEIIPRLSSKHFRTTYSKYVYREFILPYWLKNNDCVKEELERLYIEKMKQKGEEDVYDNSVAMFLSGLSKKYKEAVIDLERIPKAKKYLRHRNRELMEEGK